MASSGSNDYDMKTSASGGGDTTEILDSEAIGKKKEQRQQRQREKIAEQLKQQGIDLNDTQDNENDVEGFYDTKSEIKKEDGVTIEPFRMDGFFNRDGNYVERGGDDQDPWYQQWKEQKEGQGYQKPKEQEKEEKKIEQKTPLQLRETLLKYMQPKESVIRALKRLGKRKRPEPRRPWMKNKKKKKNSRITIMSADGKHSRTRGVDMSKDTGENANPEASGVQTAAEKNKEASDKAKEAQQAQTESDMNTEKTENQETQEKDPEKKRKQDLDELTGAANELLAGGHHNVYQDTFETLQKWVENKKKKNPDPDAKVWEYMFDGDTKVHSAYTCGQMQRWHKAGYFKKAFVRKIGNNDWMPCEQSFEFE